MVRKPNTIFDAIEVPTPEKLIKMYFPEVFNEFKSYEITPSYNNDPPMGTYRNIERLLKEYKKDYLGLTDNDVVFINTKTLTKSILCNIMMFLEMKQSEVRAFRSAIFNMYKWGVSLGKIEPITETITTVEQVEEILRSVTYKEVEKEYSEYINSFTINECYEPMFKDYYGKKHVYIKSDVYGGECDIRTRMIYVLRDFLFSMMTPEEKDSLDSIFEILNSVYQEITKRKKGYFADCNKVYEKSKEVYDEEIAFINWKECVMENINKLVLDVIKFTRGLFSREKLPIGNNGEEIHVDDIIVGEIMEPIYKWLLPRIRFTFIVENFSPRIFVFNAEPDGIGDNLIYEFKATRSTKTLPRIRKVAEIQSSLYAFLFGKKYTYIEILTRSQLNDHMKVNYNDDGKIIFKIESAIKKVGPKERAPLLNYINLLNYLNDLPFTYTKEKPYNDNVCNYCPINYKFECPYIKSKEMYSSLLGLDSEK